MHGKKLILGMGSTGASVARLLQTEKISFDICDSKLDNIESFQAEYPQAKFLFIDESTDIASIDLTPYDEIIASPGVDLNKNPLAFIAKNIGMPIIGDIELFARNARVPCVCITGSNGKTTVTTLVGQMFKKAGYKVGVGGNIGTPALDLLDLDADVFVLELSSFQLDTTFSLKPKVGVILNITPDHLDRHLSMENYINAKHKIYKDAQYKIYFAEDKLSYPNLNAKADFAYSLENPKNISFGLAPSLNKNAYSVAVNAKGNFINCGDDLIVPTQELALFGKIGVLNSMLALAIGDIFKIPRDKILDILRNFENLPHRLEKVGEQKGVVYYNDSKATNIGATLAGVENLSDIHKNILLILGGDGKAQDFSPLKSMKNIKTIAIFGRDKQVIYQALKANFNCELTTSLEESLLCLNAKADFGDAVVLSPACASLDMYKNYQQRGEEFKNCVLKLINI